MHTYTCMLVHMRCMRIHTYMYAHNAETLKPNLLWICVWWKERTRVYVYIYIYIYISVNECCGKLCSETIIKTIHCHNY